MERTVNKMSDEIDDYANANKGKKLDLDVLIACFLEVFDEAKAELNYEG